MSLKAFHLVFIFFSAATSGWSFFLQARKYQASQESAHLALCVLFGVVAAVLVGYFFYALKHIKALSKS
jgi:hypothetical protein